MDDFEWTTRKMCSFIDKHCFGIEEHKYRMPSEEEINHQLSVWRLKPWQRVQKLEQLQELREIETYNNNNFNNDMEQGLLSQLRNTDDPKEIKDILDLLKRKPWERW